MESSFEALVMTNLTVKTHFNSDKLFDLENILNFRFKFSWLINPRAWLVWGCPSDFTIHSTVAG